MNELKIFKNPEFGQSRMVDVTEILEYQNGSRGEHTATMANMYRDLEIQLRM